MSQILVNILSVFTNPNYYNPTSITFEAIVPQTILKVIIALLITIFVLGFISLILFIFIKRSEKKASKKTKKQYNNMKKEEKMKSKEKASKKEKKSSKKNNQNKSEYSNQYQSNNYNNEYYYGNYNNEYDGSNYYNQQNYDVPPSYNYNPYEAPYEMPYQENAYDYQYDDDYTQESYPYNSYTEEASSYYGTENEVHSDSLAEQYHLNPRTTSIQREALDILGLYLLEPNEISSNIKQIRDAYKVMAKRYHPDLNKNPGTAEHFLKIKSSFESLEAYF